MPPRSPRPLRFLCARKSYVFSNPRNSRYVASGNSTSNGTGPCSTKHRPDVQRATASRQRGRAGLRGVKNAALEARRRIGIVPCCGGISLLFLVCTLSRLMLPCTSETSFPKNLTKFTSSSRKSLRKVVYGNFLQHIVNYHDQNFSL